MAQGSGKYDDLVTRVREEVCAQCVALIVVGGTRGSGFSVQVMSKELQGQLPDLLRRMADDIEKQQRN